MKKVWFFLLSATIFTSLIFLPFKNQVLAEPQKYKIAKVANVNACIKDDNGPYTLPECQDALANLQHPGNYKIGKVLGNIDACVQDPSGPYTYSQCQDALANLQHPGNYKIDTIKVLGKDVVTCVPDPSGSYTYSQCQDALLIQNSQAPTSGQNPCVGGICNTAIGNIPTGDIRELANQVLRIATGIAGGLALILMVIGAIRVLASSGDQQKPSGGRDMLVAAVSGLLFLIFSVIILRFIGIDILGL